MDDLKKAEADFASAQKLDENSETLYAARGKLYFDIGQFDKAIADYKKAIELEPAEPYHEVRLYLARRRTGKPQAVPGLIKVRTKLRADRWITQVVRMYLGEITPAMCLAAAAHANPKKNRDRVCEAHYYIAQLYLIRGDKKRAGEHFRKCVETEVKYFVEYHSSKMELKRLEKAK